MTRCQRWRDGSARWAGREVIVTSAYEVVELDDDTTPRAFVERHHYSRSYPAARARFGLYRGAELVGVAVFSQPVSTKMLEVTPDLTADADLGRFVLLEDVAANGETWFLGRCAELLYRDHGWRAFVSTSDPIKRTAADGTVTCPGHVGYIYQGSNARYVGRTTARTLALLPDGTVLNDRTQQKIRKRERGWRPAVNRLIAMGAAPVNENNTAAWLGATISQLCRRVRHPGNHKYVFGLDRRVRRSLPASLPYPKSIKPGGAP